MLFCSNRLEMNKLEATDASGFFDIVGNEKTMSPIPLSTLSRTQSDAHLLQVLQNKSIRLFAIKLKENNSFIGFCGLVRDNEILYRFKPKYWGNGYGKETVNALINYCFENLKKEYLTAEANLTNIGSVKILKRFMNETGSYLNQELNCTNITFRKVNNEV